MVCIRYSSLLCFVLQLFKNIKTSLSSWAIQQAMGQICPAGSNLLTSMLEIPTQLSLKDCRLRIIGFFNVKLNSSREKGIVVPIRRRPLCHLIILQWSHPTVLTHSDSLCLLEPPSKSEWGAKHCQVFEKSLQCKNRWKITESKVCRKQSICKKDKKTSKNISQIFSKN